MTAVCFSATWGYSGAAAQGLTSTPALMHYDEVLVDTHSFNAAADGTIVVPQTGFYLVIGQVRSDGGAYEIAQITKDGVEVRKGRNIPDASGTDKLSAPACWVGCCPAGTVLRVMGSIASGTETSSFGHLVVIRVPSPFVVAEWTDSATSPGLISWDDVSDIPAWHDNDSNDTRFTVTETGNYFICVDTHSEVDPYQLELKKNGSAVTGQRMTCARFDGSAPLMTILPLTAGDYIEANVVNNGINNDATGHPLFLMFKLPSGGKAVAVKDSDGESFNHPSGRVLAHFDGEDVDTDSFHSTVTNNGRLTVPSGGAGTYLIYGGFQLEGAVAIGALIIKNSDTDPPGGSQLWDGQQWSDTGSPASVAPITAATLADGDYVTFYVGNNTPSAKTASDLRFGMLRLDDLTYTTQTCPGGTPWVPQINRVKRP